MTALSLTTTLPDWQTVTLETQYQSYVLESTHQQPKTDLPNIPALEIRQISRSLPKLSPLLLKAAWCKA
jgi:hypothetical protein